MYNYYCNLFLLLSSQELHTRNTTKRLSIIENVIYFCQRRKFILGIPLNGCIITIETFFCFCHRRNFILGISLNVCIIITETSLYLCQRRKFVHRGDRLSRKCRRTACDLQLFDVPETRHTPSTGRGRTCRAACPQDSGQRGSHPVSSAQKGEICVKFNIIAHPDISVMVDWA